ncbi:MAG TPA: glycoside hydrolase family 2 TIM barrel-domain containing protein, partial [bacterium]|nr:glycoside hydrolase family 2 TIM barrel-domain containing protein [bacterium]
MEIRLDGHDWQLLPLLPFEQDWRKVWEEKWEPATGFPATSDWISGTVPGDVISDAVEAGLAPDPWVDRNSLCCEWLSERNWVYRKKFAVGTELRGKTVRLRFDGVDHSCTVYLNGETLGSHEGMCLPFEFNVTDRIRFDAENTLVVVTEHAPSVSQVQGQIGRTSQARVWKARFAYDWDWCTRLIPLGIWQSVRLLVTDPVWLDDVWVRPQISDGTANIVTRATMCSSDSSVPVQKVRIRALDPDGVCFADQKTEVAIEKGRGVAEFSIAVPAPRLWYPNDMGEQPLYRIVVELVDEAGNVSDTKTVSCGLRQVRMIPNENAAPDALPYTLEINGKRLFVKGWNWVPIDQMYGRVQPERYERWLNLVVHAHGNLLRVWGGGYLEREEFYELCDRKGILVWQEFMQSSSGIDNAPPTDDEYLGYIENQARSLVVQRRNHPSLVIWCGGNELMEADWTPLNDAAPSLARLKSVVRELDPDRIWLPTSASGPTEGANEALAGTGKLHDVHGPWQYQGPEEHYRYFEKIDPLFHSEFGTEGSTNLWTLRRFVSEKFLFPPDPSNPVWVHHGAWWLHRPKLEQMFGSLETIEEFVKASQWMQAEGLRYIIESHRRRKWHCSGTCPWQFNESFPNTACTNSVDYLGWPKPVYWWVRRAYEPIHISLKYE